MFALSGLEFSAFISGLMNMSWKVLDGRALSVFLQNVKLSIHYRALESSGSGRHPKLPEWCISGFLLAQEGQTDSRIGKKWMKVSWSC